MMKNKMNTTVKRLMDGRDTLALVDWRGGFSNGGNFLELHRDGEIIEMGDCNCYTPGCDMSDTTLRELREQVAAWLDCVVEGDEREDVILEAMAAFDEIIRFA
jgi:hypothetical protein